MSVKEMPLRESLWGEHANTHHVPNQREAMINDQARMLVGMPEVAQELMLDHSGVEQISYPMARVWLWEDGLPPGATPDAAATNYVARLITERPWVFECARRAEAKGKKFGIIITNEYLPAGEKEIQFFGDFSAAVLEQLAATPGLWGIVGNWAMGNITQEWWDAFLTPRLEKALKAGLGAVGIHEYFYVHPASLMRYTHEGKEYNFLAGSFLPESWPPPVPTPEEIRAGEAHLIGRTFTYVDMPEWVPIFVLECGADAVTVKQAKDWEAPYRKMDDGSEETFSGVNTLKPFLMNHWKAKNGVRFYVEEYLSWLHRFYRQFEQVFGLAHFCTGDNYGQFEEHDLGKENDVGAGRLREIIAAGEFKPKVAAWKWAQRILTPQPEEPPVEIPPEEPPAEEPPTLEAFNQMLATLAAAYELEADALKVQSDARRAAATAIKEYLASTTKETEK